MNGSDAAISPPSAARARVVTAASISLSLRTGAAVSSTASVAGIRSKLTQKAGVVWRGLRIKQDSCPPDVGRNLFEYLQPLSHHGVVDEREAGNVAARTREACDETLTNWIGDDGEDDRDGAGRLLKSRSDRRGKTDEYLRRQAHHFFRPSPSKGAAGEAVVDLNGAAFRPSERLKSMPKGLDAGVCFWIILHESVQETDAPHLFGLLRVGAERPSDCRATEKPDELAPSHRLL